MPANRLSGRASLAQAGGDSDSYGIFRGDGGPLIQIARKGQTAPGGNGTFSGFGEPTLNNAGQVAFQASLTGTIGGSSDDNGIFVFDDALGLVQVVRKRESLLGRLIVTIGVGGLNEPGQVAYWFKLADGYEGIAIWTVLPPGDYNADNVVDAADYVVWRKNHGTLAEYDTWRANFGTAPSVRSGSVIVECGQSAPVSSIPEPTSILLSVFGTVAVLVLGRRYRLGPDTRRSIPNRGEDCAMKRAARTHAIGSAVAS